MKTFFKKMVIGVVLLVITMAFLAGFTWFVCMAPKLVQVIVVGLFASFGIGHISHNFYNKEIKSRKPIN